MAYRVTTVSVSSYLAFPSLPQIGNPKKAFKARRLSYLRRYISVALSLKSPSPDVIRHPVLCCSDFPHGINAPRPYGKLKSFYIIPRLLKKITLFSLLFLRKNSKIIIMIFIKWVKVGSFINYSSIHRSNYEENQNHLHNRPCKWR